MDRDRRHHLQDIYQTDERFSDDFTPQVSKEVFEERQRDIRRHQFSSFMLGTLAVVISVGLVFVVGREYLKKRTVAPSPTPLTQEYIPRYTLPTGSQWVLDFGPSYGDTTWDGEGERPFDATWVKKAAFNLILAEQATELEDYERAVLRYKRALEIFPELEGVDLRLGLAYFKLKDFENALNVLEKVPEEDLGHDMLNNLGAACTQAKAYDRAERYFNLAIEMKPAYAGAMKNMANLYKEMKREDEAVSMFEKYLDLRPDDVGTREVFAIYLSKLGRWQHATELLESLTAEVTDVPVFYFLLARAHSNNGDPAMGMKALQRGIQLMEPNAALAWMNKADFDLLRQSESEEFQQMIQMLERNSQ